MKTLRLRFMRRRPSKSLWLLAPLAAFLLSGCVDLLTPFMQGREAALQANARDRQNAIRLNIDYFNQTGDWGYLCNAAALGYRPAAEHLSRNGVKCQSGR